MPNKRCESGNVFMFILLGIVLFGALAFTVARGFRSDSTSAMTDRQAELAATDILNYGRRVEMQFDKLRRKGCSQDDILFTGGPDDCAMFNGSQSITAQPPPENAKASGITVYSYKYNNENKLSGIGTDTNTSGKDLVMFLPGIREKVCQEINVAAVGSSDIPEEGDRDLNLQDAVNFASAATGTLHFCNDNAISCSEMEMCIHQTGGIFGWADGQGYIYFKVLMPR